MSDDLPARENAGASRPDWWCASALKLHAVMLVGVAGSLAAGWLEWTRARSGHEIAWVYTFEWPLFAVMGVWLWWRLLHPEPRSGQPNRAHRRPPAGGAVGNETRASAAADDPELTAWQAYLERLHASDPPGGPPDADRRLRRGRLR